jgi:DHA2 family methylenomycin A resistance protein-like MFS transporter
MGTTTARTAPARRPSWTPLLAVSLGYFVVILDATAVNVALPAVGRELGGGISGLQWVVDGYTLTFATLLLSAGVAGDRFGPRRMFLAGLALFTAASAGCALAPSLAVLVVIRLVQGAAAAVLVPTSLALLQASYTDRAARARAVGLWGGIGGLAAASGPVLGGALTTAASWRLVFALNVPAGILAARLTLRRVAAPAGARGRGGDPAGQLAIVVALTALTGGLIEAGPHGWASWPVAAGLAVAAVSAAGFLAAERRVASPMLPPAMLRHRALRAGSLVGLLINLGFYGQLFVFSLYLQQARGDSPATAGLSLLPEAAAVPVAAVLSGRVTSRRGPRLTMITGLVIGGAGLAGLAVAGHRTPYWLLVAPMLAAGSGMALTMPAATTAVLEAAPQQRRGAAAGLLNSARQVGGALGVALAGSLVSGQLGFVPGLRLALASCAAAFGLGLVVTLAAIGAARDRQPAGAEVSGAGYARWVTGPAPSPAWGTRSAGRGPRRRSARWPPRPPSAPR